MPVAGTPIVVRILQQLRDAGVSRVVLNLHHRPETITRIVGDGSAWKLQVRYSWEPVILGSAGGPRRALDLLDADRFLIINGDTLTDCDLRALAARHLATEALVTMAVVPGDVERYGGVVTGPDGVVHGFARARKSASDAPERSAPGESVFHFIGVQAADSAVFADLPDDAPTEIVRTVYPQLIRRRPGAVGAFVSDAEFLDVGTARDYLETVAHVAAREGRPFDRGDECEVAADAELSRTILWDRVKIGPGARLENCIVADDVLVPAGGVFHDRVLVNAA